MVYVYISQFPFAVEDKTILPPERAAEIESCSNQDVRLSKFYAWKLLENALMRTFGLQIGELNIKCTLNGKWECPECHFSLSHSGHFVAVALSHNPVGVDIEKCNKDRFTHSLAQRIVTDCEWGMIASLEESARSTALNALWTKKEAIFKLVGGDTFQPKRIQTSKFNCLTKSFMCKGQSYFITVASKDAEQTVFVNTDEFEFTEF